MQRRDFLKTSVGAAAGLVAAGTAGLATATPAGAQAKSKVRKLKLGFIALTDCAPLVVAKELGYFSERNLDVTLVKQASWPATRDNILKNEIQGGHVLFSMPLSVASKVGGDGSTGMKVSMVLNNNGQCITMNKDFAAVGYADLKGARERLESNNPTLAMTFPGGTHDTWLRYWVKATKSKTKPNIIPIPPPQMVANMKVGTMDAFCVGEPWNAVAVSQKVGFTHLASQDIWEHHPEKALVVNDKTAKDTALMKDLMGAVLKACKWLDASAANIRQAAKLIAPANYINAPAADIQGRLLGKYDLGNGLGTKDYGATSMKFHRGGLTNFPRRSHALFFLASFQRFGYISKPDYSLASKLLLQDLYVQVAQAEKVPVPNDDMKPFKLKLDGATFDPAKPQNEAKRP
jgi:nitrate/nitrite transport system substrate-binding protein